jgi:hypothetical protein
MITMITNATEPFTIAAGRSQPLGEFKGTILFKNLSSAARAKYRVQNGTTNEVPVQGELENFPPQNERLERVLPGFKALVIYNDSDAASIQVTLTPDP